MKARWNESLLGHECCEKPRRSRNLDSWTGTLQRAYLTTWLAVTMRSRHDREDVRNPILYCPAGPLEPLIRLIELDRDSQGTISCHFVVANPSEERGFVALSYTWGDPAPTRDINIDGHPFKISENLWQALDNILTHKSEWLNSRMDSRQRPRSTNISISYYFSDKGQRWPRFWIHQICINKNNMNERNHQVSLMHKIYGLANFVLVWLGPSDQMSDEVFKFLQLPGPAALQNNRFKKD